MPIWSGSFFQEFTDKLGLLQSEVFQDFRILFFDGDQMTWIAGEWIETPNTHGTGCTLSSAIAAHLARGGELLESVREGKAFVTEAIRAALPLGGGIGPVDQLWGISER